MGKYTVQTKVFAVDDYCSGPYTKTVAKGREILNSDLGPVNAQHALY